MHHKKLFYIFSMLLFLTILVGCGASGASSVPVTTPSSENGGTGGGGSSTAIATISWDAPTTNLDGSPLYDLAGYRIYYGTSSHNYIAVIDVGNVITYTIGGMVSGTYYFSITAYDTSGNESPHSNEVIKTVM